MTQSDTSGLMSDLVAQLIPLGLSDNEARSYATLLSLGPLTGYEVAKHSGIARGNVYACLARLVEKEAVMRTSEDQFLALPLAQFSVLQQEHFSLASERANQALQQLRQRPEAAQVVSILGTETFLQRCMTILKEAESPIFIAGFPTDLNALAPALKHAQERNLSIEAISFGTPPSALPYALEHLAADDIRSAQQGRLLVLAAFPHAIIGVVSEEAVKTAGIWAWNRYLASVVGLYVAHERFILQLWPRLPIALQKELTAQCTDLSSRIALAGLSSDQPLLHLLEGTLTPSV
jgi:sugar-specific transcriptional regulator TrmB